MGVCCYLQVKYSITEQKAEKEGKRLAPGFNCGFTQFHVKIPDLGKMNENTDPSRGSERNVFSLV